MRILVVEDEPILRRAYVRALELRGNDVDAAATAASARERLQTPGYDAVTLDRKLPDGDGLALCRELRERGDRTPIVMLTSSIDDDEIIEGLRQGADDYVLKPVSVAVLAARLAAVLRRARRTVAVQGIRLDMVDLSLELSTPATPYRPPQTWRQKLTPREARLLAALIEQPDEVVPREKLYEVCWGRTGAAMRWNRLDVLSLRLRGKLGALANRLETVRCEGLCLTSR